MLMSDGVVRQFSPLPKGKTEVHGSCRDCGKRFTRNATIGGNIPVYCLKCEHK